MVHTPAFCGIAGCKNEAECFIENPVDSDKTLYLCRDHTEEMSPDYEPVHFPIVTKVGTYMKEFEIGEYSCDNKCNVCNP